MEQRVRENELTLFDSKSDTLLGSNEILEIP
jgi:hypothetical protein